MKVNSMDSSHKQILEFTSDWPEKFESEKIKLREVFTDPNIEIEHIGSTSVPGLASKDIVDIAVRINTKVDAEQYLERLSNLGYIYDEPASSGERHFFRKGNPTEFHLSIAYRDIGGFWNRQITFRDYLRNNSDYRDLYSDLKKNLLQLDPTGGSEYIGGKTEFIENVLKLAENNKVI